MKNRLNLLKLKIWMSVETMYPLMKSAVKDVSKQLSAGVSIDEVVLSKNSMYTEKLILDAVKAVLDEQRL